MSCSYSCHVMYSVGTWSFIVLNSLNVFCYLVFCDNQRFFFYWYFVWSWVLTFIIVILGSCNLISKWRAHACLLKLLAYYFLISLLFPLSLHYVVVYMDNFFLRLKKDFVRNRVDVVSCFYCVCSLQASEADSLTFLVF